ncbi:hypothetical protein F5Y09DRAFT_341997 [Xylaria sp. FL1042]|nr:hypothetical protein F5Y09DRAFT_341997 [Xylaria sp. FL1042]
MAGSFLELFAFQKGTNFGACITSLASPKVSPDGRTLYRQAAPVGTVAHALKRKMIVAVELFDTEGDMISFLKSAAKIPTEYGSARESGLDALARTLIADSAIDGDPTLGLIDHLNIKFSKYRRKLARLSKPGPQPTGVEGYVSRKMEARNHDPSEEEAKILAKSLDEAWTELKSNYPNKPWPSSDAKPGQEPASEYKNFLEVAVKVNGWRILFLTRGGFLGIGGCWMEQGDAIMLVESGYVAYLFGSAEERTKKDVKLKKEALEKAQNEPHPLPTNRQDKQEKLKVNLKASLDGLHRRMGKQGGAWALKSEAYVHGVMHGEAMEGSLAFEPIAVN